MTSTLILIGGLFLLLMLFLYFVPVVLWVTAIVSGVRVGII